MPVKQCEQKNKNHMVIPTDAEKSFNKIQHPFMIKKKNNSSESGHRETYVNMIRPYMSWYLLTSTVLDIFSLSFAVQ